MALTGKDNNRFDDLAMMTGKTSFIHCQYMYLAYCSNTKEYGELFQKQNLKQKNFIF